MASHDQDVESTVPTNYAALSEYLRQHVETEEVAVAEYARLLEERPDDVVSYLMRLILSDETRHHTMFAEIRNALESTIQWRSIEPRVPTTSIDDTDRDALLEATEHLLALEREDERELKNLRKKWAREPGERRLWSLLVETAELDTKKHIRILIFIRDLLRERS